MSSNGDPSETPVTDPGENPRDDPQTQIAPDADEPAEGEQHEG